MLGRIKKSIRRARVDSKENGAWKGSENEVGYHAKLTDLAGFDACVEACDALATSSSLAQSSSIDSKSGVRDCSITCSPDGDLLLLPQSHETKTESEAKTEENCSSTTEEEAPSPSELTTPSKLFMTPSRKTNRKTRTCCGSPHIESSSLGLTDKSDYLGSIVTGNDLTRDREINGFSSIGWSAVASSLAIRQTESTLRDTVCVFIESLKEASKKASDERTAACAKLCETTGIGGIAIPTIPSTPLPKALRNSKRDRKSAHVDLSLLSQSEPMGSSWKNTKTLEIGPHRVGPLLYAGGTLFSSLVAFEAYHSRRQDHHAVALDVIHKRLEKRTEDTTERAYHREKILNDMQTKVINMEKAVKFSKKQALKRWEMVNHAEETVTKIMEDRMMERSRTRERLRQEQTQREAELAEEENISFATSAEIWDIVAAATANMEMGDFTPLDLPTAPISGLRDQSSNLEDSQASGASHASQRVVSENSIGSGNVMPTRAEIEEECNLPELRAAAMMVEEVVEEASHSLLTVLSALDTTRRAARLAAETNLLHSCQVQANSLKEIVKLERATLEGRMSDLEELERVVEQLDVRQDLDLYITADKQEVGGSTWMGDDDDGGIASALAILSSHVEGSTGISTSATLSWDNSVQSDNKITSEMLEDAVNEMFDEKALSEEEYEKNVQKLCEVASDKNMRSKRSSICYALNAKRTSAKCHSRAHFNGLSRLLSSILVGCDNEVGGVGNAKMCMMLSQTFYIDDDNDDEKDENPKRRDSIIPEQRIKRIFVKSNLIGHDLWKDDEFWDLTLYQCVTESLTHSGVMQNFQPTVNNNSKNQSSEWMENRKVKWHDLTHAERSEAATQVHAVVFAQLGAIAHSMMEFGCGLERSCSFVRRMCVRNQLPTSQRTMLLKHLIKSDSNNDGSNKNGET